MTVQNALLVGQSTTESAPIVDFVCRATVAQHRTRLLVPDGPNQDWFPDLVVVLQHWSDEFPLEQIHSTLASFPLARWVCCYGTWCESDGRNRPDTWPTGVRVPMRRAIARVRRELQVLDGTADPLPLTASRDETYAFDFPPFAKRQSDFDLSVGASPRKFAAVSSPDRAYRDMLQSALIHQGAMVVPLTDKRVECVVCDLDPWSHREDVIRALSVSHRVSERIGVTTMASPEAVRCYLNAGCHRVLPKFAPLQSFDRL